MLRIIQNDYKSDYDTLLRKSRKNDGSKKSKHIKNTKQYKSLLHEKCV